LRWPEQVGVRGDTEMQIEFCWRRFLKMPTSEIEKKFENEFQDGSEYLRLLGFEVEVTCGIHGEFPY
jgi:hypothetical protein